MRADLSALLPRARSALRSLYWALRNFLFRDRLRATLEKGDPAQIDRLLCDPHLGDDRIEEIFAWADAVIREGGRGDEAASVLLRLADEGHEIPDRAFRHLLDGGSVLLSYLTFWNGPSSPDAVADLTGTVAGSVPRQLDAHYQRARVLARLKPDWIPSRPGARLLAHSDAAKKDDRVRGRVLDAGIQRADADVLVPLAFALTADELLRALLSLSSSKDSRVGELLTAAHPKVLAALPPRRIARTLAEGPPEARKAVFRGLEHFPRGGSLVAGGNRA